MSVPSREHAPSLLGMQGEARRVLEQGLGWLWVQCFKIGLVGGPQERAVPGKAELRVCIEQGGEHHPQLNLVVLG